MSRDQLVLANQRLAFKLASKYRVRGMDADDLVQVALTGLVRAADTFDPSLGVRFSTWAHRRIRSELLDAVRAARAQMRKPASGSEVTGVDWSQLERVDRQPGPYEAAAERDEWEHRLKTLSPRQRQIIDLMYRDGLTAAEISVCLGISIQGVHRLHEAALAHLRRHLGVKVEASQAEQLENADLGATVG